MKPLRGCVNWLRLIFAGDLTKQWVAVPTEPVVDLDNGTLCGVGPGDPVQRLSWLGRCDQTFLSFTGPWWAPGLRRILVYRDRGLATWFHGDFLIDGLKFNFETAEDETDEGWLPYRGPFERQGHKMRLVPGMREQDVRRFLGPPACEVEGLLMFEAVGHSLLVKCDDDFGLLGLSLHFNDSPNPTRTLIRDNSIDLIADLDEGTLSGVGIGERHHRLEFLGPATDSCSFPNNLHYLLLRRFVPVFRSCLDALSPKAWHYEYGHLGIEIQCNGDGSVESMHVVVQRKAEFPGAIIINGNRYEAHELQTQAAIEAALGLPEASTEGEPDPFFGATRTYRHGRVRVDVESDEDGRPLKIGWSRANGLLPNPTKLWKRAPAMLKRVADWDDCSVFGVRLGDSMERLEVLGPANEVCEGFAPREKNCDLPYVLHSIDTREFDFLKDSLRVICGHDNKILAFRIYVSADGLFYPVWSGSLLRNGAPLPFLFKYDKRQVEKVFGRPDRILRTRADGYRGGMSFVYRGDTADRLVSFDRKGQTATILFALKST